MSKVRFCPTLSFKHIKQKRMKNNWRYYLIHWNLLWEDTQYVLGTWHSCESPHIQPSPLEMVLMKLNSTEESGSRIARMSSLLMFCPGLKVAERMGEGVKEDNGKEKGRENNHFGPRIFFQPLPLKLWLIMFTLTHLKWLIRAWLHERILCQCNQDIFT